jgi:hypothetical protein
MVPLGGGGCGLLARDALAQEGFDKLSGIEDAQKGFVVSIGFHQEKPTEAIEALPGGDQLAADGMEGFAAVDGGTGGTLFAHSMRRDFRKAVMLAKVTRAEPFGPVLQLVPGNTLSCLDWIRLMICVEPQFRRILSLVDGMW